MTSPGAVGHTKGPWCVYKRNRTSVESVQTMQSAGIAKLFADCPFEERAANARLIAAAPDLLAACIEVDKALPFANTEDLPPDSPRARLRLAIHRASGR